MSDYNELVKTLRCVDCEYGNSEWPEDPEHTKMEVGI